MHLGAKKQGEYMSYGITENTQKHSLAVARKMRDIVASAPEQFQITPRDAFLLGYVHEIGREFAKHMSGRDDGVEGEYLLRQNGYKYAAEVGRCGSTFFSENESDALWLLNYADITTSIDGRDITVEERIKEAEEEYQKFPYLVDQLKEAAIQTQNHIYWSKITALNLGDYDPFTAAFKSENDINALHIQEFAATREDKLVDILYVTELARMCEKTLRNIGGKTDDDRFVIKLRENILFACMLFELCFDSKTGLDMRHLASLVSEISTDGIEDDPNLGKLIREKYSEIPSPTEWQKRNITDPFLFEIAPTRVRNCVVTELIQEIDEFIKIKGIAPTS